MKKLVVGSLVMLLMLTMVGFSFASQNQGNEKVSWDITWDDLGTEGPEAFYFVQPKIAVAASSLLANDVANVILDNSGNYTFFKKQGSSSGDVEDRTGVTMYIKGFGAMDKFEMKDYTKFENTNYGGIIGFDWDRQYSDNFDATYGLFVAYAENELKEEDYEDDKISSKNGFAGLRGNWYIGKLFFGAVLDYGYLAQKVEMKDGGFEYDNDYKIQSIGFSAKAGYNFEVAEKSFTIQPNVVFNSNYLLVEEYDLPFDGPDYTLKTKAEDVYNFAVAPGLKIAKTLGKCWIVTAEGKYVFVSDNGKIKYESDYEEVGFPDTYYKEYASCGIGIEKIWGYTVLHIKGHKTFCGRDGYMVNAGIEFKF